MENRELTHYGILGMKWGVRRTPAQLARARGNKASKTNDKLVKNKVDSKKSSQSTKKKVSEMSDDELQKSVRRLQLEQQYRQLNPTRVSAGRKFINKVMRDVVAPAATEVARNTLKNAMDNAVKNALSKSVKK